MKSVPNLIFYVPKIFRNFSQFLAICFELFSFEVNLNSEITDERAPLVRCRAPRRARVAACRRRGLKPLSGQRAAHPDRPPRIAPAADRPTSPRLARAVVAPTAPRLTCAAVAPTASPTASPSRPKPRRPDRHPGRLAARPTPSRRRPRAGEPPFPRPSSVRRCRAAVGIDVQCRRRALRGPAVPSGPRTRPRLCGRGPCAPVAAGRARTVRLGRARFQPSGTRLNFYYFLIYSIHCKFINLCRIQLNSENYERNFVGKV
jgi:hypothetical protein